MIGKTKDSINLIKKFNMPIQPMNWYN